MSVHGIHTTAVSTDLDRSKAFYQALGLKFEGEEGGLNFAAGEHKLYIYPRDTPPKADHTLFTLEVDDVTAYLTELKQHGIEAARYPGFEQDELGISIEPQSGRKGAWVTDPDGNIIGLFED